MAAPKPNYTCGLSLLAATTSEDIHQFIFSFSAIIGEIITDMSYLCEPGGFGAKEDGFSPFPFVLS